ncbi:MAG: hypothetical protein OEY51_04685 [Cyclobacteriaceae bacterium]|nr:hypothetical protein [Cyclobacteriaceae bacterium]
MYNKTHDIKDIFKRTSPCNLFLVLLKAGIICQNADFKITLDADVDAIYFDNPINIILSMLLYYKRIHRTREAQYSFYYG